MASNTDLADVNEIYVAYKLNGSQFPDRASEDQFNRKIQLLNEQQASDQIARGDRMVTEFLRWAETKGFRGVTNVYWTARPGFSFKAVTGVDVNQKKNPTDVLVEFRAGGFLGLSAKSTGGKADIGFKNPGVGTVERDLGIQINPIKEEAEKTIISQYNLPSSAGPRKSAIRSNPTVQKQTDAAGQRVLAQSRDVMLKRLNMMAQPQRKQYIIDSWMDADSGMFPPYVKVTGRGTKGVYSAVVEDPQNNPKLVALSTGSIQFSAVGNESIGVMAGSKKILKMRFKFESEKLASSLKMSGDPW